MVIRHSLFPLVIFVRRGLAIFWPRGTTFSNLRYKNWCNRYYYTLPKLVSCICNCKKQWNVHSAFRFDPNRRSSTILCLTKQRYPYCLVKCKSVRQFVTNLLFNKNCLFNIIDKDLHDFSVFAKFVSIFIKFILTLLNLKFTSCMHMSTYVDLDSKLCTNNLLRNENKKTNILAVDSQQINHFTKCISIPPQSNCSQYIK